MHLPASNTNSIRLCMAAIMLVAAPAVAVSNETYASDPQSSPVAETVDVTLTSHGEMQGYVVDSQGVPVADVAVRLTTDAGRVIQATSDEKGRFGYRGLKGGAYQLHTDMGVILFRAWTTQAAPPQSAATLLVVHDNTVVRGQWAPDPQVNNFFVRMKRVMSNPFAVATIVGASVAIPVAIHNANKDDSSS